MPRLKELPFIRWNPDWRGISTYRDSWVYKDDVPRGYKEIRMYVNIDADAPPEKLQGIVQLGPTYSPVFDTITRAVPVSVQLES